MSKRQPPGFDSSNSDRQAGGRARHDPATVHAHDAPSVTVPSQVAFAQAGCEPRAE
jgi:hypothetical protein